MSFLRYLALFGAAAFPVAGQAQMLDLQDARVTVPYSELRKLWEAAEAKTAKPEKEKPPTPFLIPSAKYNLRVEPGQVSGTAEFNVQVLAEGWTSVPLLGAGAQIERVEPASAQLFVQDEHFCLLTQHPGNIPVRIQFSVPLSGSGEARRATLPVPSAASGTVTLTSAGPKTRAELSGATLLREQPDGTLDYRLAAAASLTVEVHPVLPPPEPSQWTTEMQAVVRAGEGILSYQAHISSAATGGSGVAIELQLPPGARVKEVKGEDISKWSGNEKLQVEWATRGRLQREFDLQYEIPQPTGSTTWQLARPAVAGNAEPGQALFAVIGEHGLELKPRKTVTPRVTRWLSERIAREQVVWAGPDGLVDVTWLPLMPTAPATVDNAKIRTQIVADGALITESAYTIRHEEALVWQLALPEGVQLLQCAVNGRPANPVNRGKGILELALTPLQGRQATTVSVSFTDKKKPFNPVSGDVEIALPQTELLINQLDWDLSIPAGFNTGAVEGNVTPLPQGSDGLVHLRKALCRNERPYVHLFYERPNPNVNPATSTHLHL